jgi:hypothetical protein
MRYVFFIFFLLSLHIIAVAKDSDLRHLFPPIRFQTVGNCYAQTGADLLTVHLKTLQNNKIVAPFSLATCSKIEKLNMDLENAKLFFELRKTPDYELKVQAIKDLGGIHT